MLHDPASNTARNPAGTTTAGAGSPAYAAWHHRGRAVPAPRRRGPALLLAVAAVAVSVMVAACGGAGPAAGTDPASGLAPAATMTEYVGGHWVPFTASKRLTAAQWAVVDAYANFSSAALAVYSARSIAPLVTVISPQSEVSGMFARDLAAGKNPEALYTKAVVESVAISGCRASLALELYYPGGRSLRYVSSWVRPFDRALLRRTGGGRAAAAAMATQRAPWLFVGDNRVGGADAPCGI
jgi:hypothetical protein